VQIIYRIVYRIVSYLLNHCWNGWVRSTNLYHSRQWFNILNPRSGRTDYTAVCFVTHDQCSRIRILRFFQV